MLFIILVLFVRFAYSNDLSQKLDHLNVPEDQVTNLLSEESLISVTGRYSPLILRHELSLKGGHNFMSDGHLQSRQAAALYRFHLNSRWSLGVSYQEYENKLSEAGEKLFDDQKILPDSDFAIKGVDIFVGLNTFYGKLRVTQRQIVYFDHFISIGYGHIALASGEEQVYTADTGLVFWLGKNTSFRLGMKNEFYRQKKLTQNTNAHNAMGYLEVGYLL